jgi:glycosyltransferase involved in cell wall biosynthesis
MIMPDGAAKLLILIPAFNEESAVGAVVGAVKSAVPGAPVLVVDDCSRDATVMVARDAGAEVLALPHHLGLGGCVQAGYKLAYELGYKCLRRCAHRDVRW